MLKKIKSPLFIALAVTALILMFAIRMVAHHQNNFQQIEESVNVEVENVKRSNLPIESHTIGSLVSAHNVQITPEISGVISTVFFKDGTFVKKDTPLIQLDDTVLKSKLESARANFLYSETDYNRKVLLAKQGAISRQAVDQALADLAEKRALARESEVSVAKMRLLAPFDGVVGKIKISPGDYVTTGKELVSLTDTKNLQVEYTLSEKFFSQLKLGQTVKITTNAYPNREFKGTLAFISPTVNPQDHTLSVYAEIPNDENLLTSGLFVNVSHELGIASDAIVVSADSLVPTIDGQEIFKVVKNKAVLVAVVLGERTENKVQIAKGLSDGDIIVIAGQEKLKEGTPVTYAPTHTGKI